MQKINPWDGIDFSTVIPRFDYDRVVDVLVERLAAAGLVIVPRVSPK